jgi:hypothetical protein
VYRLDVDIDAETITPFHLGTLKAGNSTAREGRDVALLANGSDSQLYTVSNGNRRRGLASSLRVSEVDMYNVDQDPATPIQVTTLGELRFPSQQGYGVRAWANALEWMPSFAGVTPALFGAGFIGPPAVSGYDTNTIFKIPLDTRTVQPVFDLKKIGRSSAGDIAFDFGGKMYLSINGGDVLEVALFSPDRPLPYVIHDLPTGTPSFDGLIPLEPGVSLVGITADRTYYKIDLAANTADLIGTLQHSDPDLLDSRERVRGASVAYEDPLVVAVGGTGNETVNEVDVVPRFGQLWYKVTIGGDGPFSATLLDGGGVGASLKLYDDSGSHDLVAEGSSRVFTQVTSGQVLYLHAEGLTGPADLQFSTLPVLDVVVSPSTFFENVGTGAATGTLTRIGSDEAVTVVLASSDVTAATVRPTTVEIPAGVSSVEFTMDAVDDPDSDGTQTTIVTATAAGHLGGSARVDVIDNEQPKLLVAFQPGSVSETAGANAATGTVSRTGLTDAAVTVSLTSNNIGEATVAPATVTIPAGQAGTTFAVNTVDELVDDGEQSVTIMAAAAGHIAGNGQIAVTDNDTAGITVNLRGGVVTTETGGRDTFTVALTSEPTAIVTVNVSSDDETEGTVSPASLTFTPGTWNQPQTVTVTGVDDQDIDDDTPFTMSLAIISADRRYNDLDPEIVAATNVDNERYVDLVASINEAGSTIPAATVSGSGAPINLSVVVTNLGKDSLARGQRMTLGVYARPDGVSDASQDTKVATLQRLSVSRLRAFSSRTFRANVYLPPGMTTGNYRLVVVADEADNVPEVNEGNNAAVRAQLMHVERGYVDLVGTFSSVNLPSAVVAGRRVTGIVRVQVRNDPANVALPNGQRVDVVVIAKSKTTGAVQTLGIARNQSVSRLGPGLAKTLTVRVNKLDGLAIDEYDVLARIVPVQPLTEEQTANNEVTVDAGGQSYQIKSAAPFWDLVPSFNEIRTNVPENTISGDGTRLQLWIVIANEGNVSLPRGQRITLGVYARPEGAVDDSQDVPVATLAGRSVSNLGAQRSRTFRANVFLPLGMDGGNYRMVVVADEGGDVPELPVNPNELNNTAVLPQLIDVTRGYVDLSGAFSSEGLPSEVAAGQRLRGWVRVQVRNDPANVPLPLGQRVDVSLIARSTSTGIEQVLATARNRLISRLGPGSGKTIYVPVDKADGLPAGTYDLLARLVPVQPLPEEQVANNDVTQDLLGNGYQLQVN